MTISESDSTVTDRQVSLILRRAIELQDREGEGTASEQLSLEVVREIASEIGLESRFVDQAAASVLEGAGSSRASTLLGGPIRERLEASVGGPLSEEGASELVDRIRSVVHRQGEVSHVLGSVEWRSEGEPAIGVTISPRGDRTRVRIVGDRSKSLAPTLAIPSIAGLAVAGIVVDSLQPGTSAMLGILGTGGIAGLAIGRATWAIMARSFRRRLEALREEVGRFMPGVAEEPAARTEIAGGDKEP